MDARKRDQLLDQFSAYLDDELTPARRREVEALLAEDATARALLAELRATARAVQELPRARASERLMEGLRTRMEREALLGDLRGGSVPTPRERSFSLRWMSAAAVIGLAFLTFYMVDPMSLRTPAPITVASKEPDAQGDARRRGPDAQQSAAPQAPALHGARGEPGLAKSSPRSAPSPELQLFGSQELALAADVRRENEHSARSMVRESSEAGRELRKAAAEQAPEFGIGRADASVHDSITRAGENQADPAGRPPEIPGSGETQRIALIEVTTPDPVSQQKAAALLKTQFAFLDADAPALAATPRPAQAAATSNEAGRYFYSEYKNGSSPPDLATADAAQLGMVPNTSPAEAAPDGSAIALTCVLSDEAVGPTVRAVQAQWPGATVRFVRAQSPAALRDKRRWETPAAPAGAPSRPAAAEHRDDQPPAAPAASAPAGDLAGSTDLQYARARALSPVTQPAQVDRNFVLGHFQPAIRTQPEASSMLEAAPRPTSLATSPADQLEALERQPAQPALQPTAALPPDRPTVERRIPASRPVNSPATAGEDARVIMVYLRVAPAASAPAVAVTDEALPQTQAAPITASQPEP